MSNQFTDDRFVIDTPSADLLLSTLMPHAPNTMRVSGIRWVGYGGPLAHCLITDADGMPLWEAVHEGSVIMQVDASEYQWQDFRVPRLTDGRLYIYLSKGQAAPVYRLRRPA
jgi:hypothetical protein